MRSLSMKKTKPPLDPLIKKLIGIDTETPDDQVLKQWKQACSRVCKPCWELRYCPYGPLVEEFPLVPPTKASALEHHEYLKHLLRSGSLPDGTPLEEWRWESFQKQVDAFDLNHYPEQVPPEISDMQCTVFGHICPVVFTAERYTETSEARRTGRYLPFQMKMRIVRRDNYTCQHCAKHLLDDEVEFDHVIPISKGGSSDEHNIRLTCHDCNADKSDKVAI
jgi:hypothetical protein